MPVFSIITVVYNGADLLLGTMESVRKQTYPDLEHIIIDGASNETGVNLIRQYAATMPYLRWISEPNDGLFDAMNKGLHLATGDFILFLKCGDLFHTKDAIQGIAVNLSPRTDVLYGDAMEVDPERNPEESNRQFSLNKAPVMLDWRDYIHKMMVPYTSFAVRRSLAPDFITGNAFADLDWCIRVLKASRGNKYTGITVADTQQDSNSNVQRLDRFKVLRSHFGLFPALAKYLTSV
jgi:glycosyltransferase involved in cell wall biosynthesis